MALPPHFLQELKSRADIADIVSGYVNLKRRGKNLLGLCPFHNEKTPSFNVSADNQFFHCFGCGAGGDVITFIMKIENLDYIEAVKFLAQRTGMQMPENGVDDSMSKLRSTVLEINRETAKFFHSVLMSEDGKIGLNYFLKRGISQRVIRHFGLGYAPDSRYQLVNHLRKLGYKDADMVTANVAFVSRNGNTVDRFFGRVMFPIIDLRGNVVAFGGRILSDEKPKYINTSDTPVYHKSSGLFAMNFAKNNEGQLILAEGYMDVIALHKAGFTNAIATLGTALTQEQARIISRYCKEVVVCFDSDEAGQKATQRAIPILRSEGILVKVLTIPSGKDPDGFINDGGKDGPLKFKALLDKCGNDLEYRMAKIKLDCDMESEQGKVEYLTACAKLLAAVENSIERDVYAGKLSAEINVDKTAILNQISKYFKQNMRNKQKQNQTNINKELAGANDNINKEKVKNIKVANAEEALIAYMLKYEDGLDFCKKNIEPDKFITDFNKRVYSVIIQKNRAINMTDLSADFNSAEMGALSKILMKYDLVQMSQKDALEYINLVKEQGIFKNLENIKQADNGQLADYFEMIKKRKK